MSMFFRIISGAAGVTILVGTAVFALNLVSMGHDASVYLAAYMGIGGLLIAAFLLFYGVSGKWRPSLTGRKDVTRTQELRKKSAPSSDR